MGKIQYTPSQLCAMAYPDGNLLVSAAAGSGKTATLTARIVQLVLDGRAELRDMLIVTFTKAAAAEMKMRLSRMLREKMEEGTIQEPLVRSRIAQALSQIPSADISTIHSFLYQSLKPYFPALGLSQDTSIGETRDMDRIKADCMRDVTDDFFAAQERILSLQKQEKTEENTGFQEESGFLTLADTIGQARDTSSLDAELLWLMEKLSNMGQNVGVLRHFAADLSAFADGDVDFMKTKYGRCIREELEPFTEHYRAVFDMLADEMDTEPEVLEKYGPALQGIRDFLEELSRLLREEAGYEALRAHFIGFQPENLGRLSKKNATETSFLFKQMRDELKKDRTKIGDDLLADSADEAHRAAVRTAGVLREAATVLEEYERRLAEKKQRMSLLEYGDLERLAEQLLTGEDGGPSAAAEEIGKKYKYIFVDEYQDTNAVQDRIFTLLSRHAVRFMVGDIKQSIYRFRGADPRVFSSYRTAWPKLDTEKTDIYADTSPEGGASLFMSENFRCRPEIIRTINRITDKILPFGGIPYEPEDALVCGTEPETGTSVPCELVLLDRKKPENEEEMPETDENTDKTIHPEARYVAARIHSLVGTYSPWSGEIIRPADIAILLRSPSSHAADYRDALEQVGIASAARLARPLSDFPAVLLLVSLLRMIDNPLRDISAAAALKSPIFDFSIAEIVELRRRAGDLPLYTAMLPEAWAAADAVDNGDVFNSDDVSNSGEAFSSGTVFHSALYRKCAAAVQFLQEEKAVSQAIGTEKYLSRLLKKTGFYRMDGIRRDGQQRDALQKILDLARQYETSVKTNSGGKSLNGFLVYLDRYLEEDMENTDPGQENAVSILSIHASKGLEFPICFLCEGAGRRNTADETRTILYDDEIGFGMQLTDETGLLKCDNIIRKTISQKMARDSRHEEMRMLYVALTRARHMLIMTGRVADADTFLGRAAQKQAFWDAYTAHRAISYLDWMTPALVQAGQNPAWTVSVVAEQDVPSTTFSTESTSTPVEEIQAAADAISSRFDFSYAHDYLADIPAKLIVSRLSPTVLDQPAAPDISGREDVFWPEDVSLPEDVSGREDTEPEGDIFRHPSFYAEQKDATAAEIGTATHHFLQFVHLGRLERDGVEAELDRLLREGFLTRAEAGRVHMRQLEQFRNSRLFYDLLRSPDVRREFRFNVRMDAADFTADPVRQASLREHGVKITVQGVVDCVYRDPGTGGMVLLDYKTDAVHRDEWKNIRLAEERFRQRHGDQLRYYRRICTDMLGEPITRTCLYSTVLGRCIDIPAEE